MLLAADMASVQHLFTGLFQDGGVHSRPQG